MKTITTITLPLLLLFGVISGLHAQNMIKLKKGRAIRNTKLYEIKSSVVVYEKDGSLHDAYIPEIEYILEGGTRIVFDKDNKPVYPEWSRKPGYDGTEDHPDSPSSMAGKESQLPEENITTHNDVRGPDQYFKEGGKRTHFFIRPLGILEHYGKVYGGLNIESSNVSDWKIGGGYLVHNYNKYDETLKGGFELGVEYKLKYKSKVKHNFKRDNYLGIGLDYKQANVRSKLIQYVYDSNTYDYYYDDIQEVNQTRELLKFNIKAGYQKVHQNGVFTDFYFGMGYRTAHISNEVWNEYDFVFQDRFHVLLGLDIGF